MGNTGPSISTFDDIRAHVGGRKEKVGSSSSLGAKRKPEQAWISRLSRRRENASVENREIFERLSGSKVVYTSETGRRSGPLEGEEERRAKLKHVSGVIEGNAARNSFHGFRKR